MRIGERFDRALLRLEWRWSLSNLLFGAYLLVSAALPAWAVSAMATLQQYAPLSWVLAGFAGLITSVLVFAVFSFAYGRWVRSRYNSYLLAKSGYVDPMAKTFENKRIFLSEFCLPSEPHIEGKAFINCDIVGPANLIIRHNNQVADQRLPFLDAVLVRADLTPHTGIYIDNCTFRGCSFKRITLLVPTNAYHDFSHLDWLRWINLQDTEPELPGMTTVAPEPNQAPKIAPPQPEGTEEEKPH